MNLTWHIVKKDLQRFRWAIAIWAVSFLYYQLRFKLDFRSPVTMTDTPVGVYLLLLSLITFGVLSVAMIVGVVQEDNLVESTVHWRTRPISPARLLAAKLLLIGVLFVILPQFVAWLINRPGPLDSTRAFKEMGFAALAAAGLSLSFAAAAACTKDLGRCMLAWLAVVVAAFLLAHWLGKIVPPLDRLTANQLIAPKGLAILSLGAGVGLAVLCSQYLLRWLALSLALLAGGALGAAIIGAAWTWNYLR